MAGLLPQPRVTAQSYFFSAVFIFSLVNIDCDGSSWAKNCPKFFDLNATQEYILVVPIPTVLLRSLSPSPRCYRWLCPHPRGITVTFVPITAVLPQLPRWNRCPHPHAALYTAVSVSKPCRRLYTAVVLMTNTQNANDRVQYWNLMHHNQAYYH